MTLNSTSSFNIDAVVYDDDDDDDVFICFFLESFYKNICDSLASDREGGFRMHSIASIV
jgi:hypothetical protein